MSQNSSGLLDTKMLAGLTAAKVAIVYTEWNDKIVGALVEGCERVLNEFKAEIIYKTAVPGAFELPFACRQVYTHYRVLDNKGGFSPNRPEAIIAFGAVIRGGTPHFDYVCKAVTDGIMQLNLTFPEPIPIIFGVLTLDNEAQAWERLGGPHGHKGEEAALTALKMIQFNRFK